MSGPACGASVRASMPRAPIFDLVEKRGPVEIAEMRRTFNCGIGFVMIVPEREIEGVSETLRAAGESPIEMGRVVAVPGDTAFEDRVAYDR